MRPGFAIIFLWALFALSWLVAAWWSAPTHKGIGFRAEIRYRVVLLIGGLIFAVPARNYYGPLRFWFVTPTEAWMCVAVIAIGFAFSWWGRVYLGPLWSGNVARKGEHAVIDTGPYAIVRHPIYFGVLVAVFATCAARRHSMGRRRCGHHHARTVDEGTAGGALVAPGIGAGRL